MSPLTKCVLNLKTNQLRDFKINSNNNEIFYSYNESKGKYYHVLHDKGSVGVFLKGFFGYNSNPNWIEFILWLGSLLFGLKMWSSFYNIGKENT